MKFRILQPAISPSGVISMEETPIEEIKVNQYALLSIDGSTSNSGLAIMREIDGALMYTISASRDEDETPVRYKIRLKNEVKKILENNPKITHIYYEEPVISNVTSVANLFMLRTFIEEMIIENEPRFDYIGHFEINNMRWKKEFLAPDKVPQGTDNQKKVVRQRLETYMPYMKVVSQDEVDAMCMGFVASQSLKKNEKGDELVSKKKTRPFKYNVVFLGADDDSGLLSELWEVYTGPKSLMENGIAFSEINSKTNFDKHIYEQMGDDDKIVVVKFSSKHHGNVILEHRIGHLSAQYDYIYAIVWRANRH